MKKLLLILLLPVLFSTCKKDENGKDRNVSYAVTGYIYEIQVVKGSAVLSEASTPVSTNLVKTTTTYNFKANKGDNLLLKYQNEGDLQVTIKSDGEPSGTLNVGMSSEGEYNFTVE